MTVSKLNRIGKLRILIKAIQNRQAVLGFSLLRCRAISQLRAEITKLAANYDYNT